MARHFRSRPTTIVSSIHKMALSRLVAHAAAFSHQLCHLKLSDWWWGGHHHIWVTLRRVPQAVWDASLADKGPPRCGQMGQESSRPPTKAAATMKTTTTMRRTIGHPQTGGFQDQARLGHFVLLLGALWASGACDSYAGVPRAAAVFSMAYS
jgi:hypothetical protein